MEKMVIRESTLRNIVSECIKARLNEEEWPLDAELDKNMNTFDDPSIAHAYAQGDDTSYIQGSTLRDRMSQKTGTGIDYSEEDLSKLIAEAIKKVVLNQK